MDIKQQLQIPTELVQSITSEQAWHYQIVPANSNKGKKIFYSSKREDQSELQDELEILYGCNIQFTEVSEEELKNALVRYYPQNKSKGSGSSQKFSGAYEDFLPKVIGEAYGIGASDIHIEVYEEMARIRFRVDGKLVERYKISSDEYPALVNKIKIQANLDIAEKRLPQDGRILFKESVGEFDIRVSSLPTMNGEKIVLRILSKDAGKISLDYLGFSKEQLEVYLKAIKRPNGIVLISGPTGSGKTTTLYATLQLLNKEETNILTIEDPIEYTLEGINQVQLKEDIGLTFSSALRTFLRQDPDIIMLGEIRDKETAQMAIRAALTGHLVFSTIHTNSAWGTISRLVDMGVPPYLLASTINLSMAQRLVRLLCPKCKQETEVNHSIYPAGFTPPQNLATHASPVGCEHCYYTGYSGRKAIYELIPIESNVAQLIKNNELDIEKLAKHNQLKYLKDAAWQLFASQQTSIDEVYSFFI
ncbi:type II/IV secretion system protein [Marinifilum breve]|uniref:Type II/IV secretion system protein n=1 Tax=Marinifilum breve TaxID=2184082 RepID=A0A2V3ZZF9_9BACT|nr:GspE/PulE family protein [Marinifilum breve]PXY01818.1 type II/IV secretion system protein [Marinifilum breve]